MNANQPTTTATSLSPSDAERKLIEACASHGEAADRIAASRPCSFWEAMLVVQTWEYDQ